MISNWTERICETEWGVVSDIIMFELMEQFKEFGQDDFRARARHATMPPNKIKKFENSKFREFEAAGYLEKSAGGYKKSG